MNGLAYEKSHLDLNTAILIHLVHSQTLNKKQQQQQGVWNQKKESLIMKGHKGGKK